MKKFITALTALFTLTLTANAMSYSQAREQALFLTDKMAYELNLSEEQYDAAYEVNLDYLMSINTYDDLYGYYWTARNADLSYILLDWQYRAFCAASYFYRPLYWTDGLWHFAIYSRYPRRDYFYFGRPGIYMTYRGGHGWHHNGGHSWYSGRTFHHGGEGHGMRDRFNNGDFGRGFSNRSGRGNDMGGGQPNNGFRGNSTNGQMSRGNNGMTNGRNINNGRVGYKNANTDGTRQYNGNGQSQTTSRPTGKFNGQRGTSTRSTRESSTRTTARPDMTNNRAATSIQSRQSIGTTQRTPTRSFTPARSSQGSSVSRSMSAPSRSFSGGGSTRGSSNGGGSHGGGHFGGRR